MNFTFVDYTRSIVDSPVSTRCSRYLQLHNMACEKQLFEYLLIRDETHQLEWRHHALFYDTDQAKRFTAWCSDAHSHVYVCFYLGSRLNDP